MPSTPHPARHGSLYILLGILLLSAILVPVIAFRYAYDTSSRIAGGLGFILLLAAFGATWLLTRTARRDEAPAALDRMTDSKAPHRRETWDRVVERVPESTELSPFIQTGPGICTCVPFLPSVSRFIHDRP